jgi:hypothetical protein
MGISLTLLNFNLSGAENAVFKMLRWALDKNTKSVISILDIQKGLEYNCICPSCGMTVIAHKGNEIAHHFKHYNIEECIGGVETAIHLKAKEIIAAVKYIKLPSLSANVSVGGYSASKLILPSSVIELDDVVLEEKEGRIRPDLIATHQETKILIEIAVTHFIDKNKKEIIRNQDISCIEIDLSELHKSNKNITDDELKQNIIERLDNKKWIHNRKYKDAKKKAFQIIEQKKQDEINQKELEKPHLPRNQ